MLKRAIAGGIKASHHQPSHAPEHLWILLDQGEQIGVTESGEVPALQRCSQTVDLIIGQTAKKSLGLEPRLQGQIFFTLPSHGQGPAWQPLL